MPGGRKRKITPEIAEKIYETLRATGSDRLAYEAANLSHTTYYKEISENPEFASGVEAARASRTQLSHTLTFNRVQAAHDYIDRCLRGEQFKHSVTETIHPRTGKIVELKRREQVLPDSKMLDRVLGQMQSDVKLEVNFGLAEPDNDAD